MKILNITILPLATVLVIGGSLLATKDYSTVDTEIHILRHTVAWDSRSFDETIWLAVDEIARIEDGLHRSVEKFHIEVQATDEAMPLIHLQFDRESLENSRPVISPRNTSSGNT